VVDEEIDEDVEVVELLEEDDELVDEESDELLEVEVEVIVEVEVVLSEVGSLDNVEVLSDNEIEGSISTQLVSKTVSKKIALKGNQDFFITHIINDRW
jgi:hypothetical protein